MKQSPSIFSMGPGTYRVPMSMHAGARQRLLDRLKKCGVRDDAVVLLQGGAQQTKYDSDRDLLFEQESFFQYLFGVKEPGFYGAVHTGSGQSTLFMPRLSEAWGVWMGRILPPSHFQEMYEVEEVRYVDELGSVLNALKPSTLLLLQGKNTDSGLTAAPAHFPGIENFKTDLAILYPEIVECRLLKSSEEVSLLRWVNSIGSAAHVEVMHQCRPGLMEYQLEAAFLHFIYDRGGCRFSAYTCICGCGPNSSILHYGHQGAPNNRMLGDGEMFLNDSGAQYHGYVSDITCSYPVNGKFTSMQRDIYESVLAANRAVQRAMKPGIPWPDMHRLAERVVTEKLRDIGIVKGSIEELMAHHISALFMPHGLGHLMGLDVHDVGGYPDGVMRIDEPAIRSLRCGRHLQAGMVITVEPGIYFIDSLLEPALADPKLSRFLNSAVLQNFRNFGGVRIEDDVLVTDDGCENFTKVPRDAAEIESVMQGKVWQIPEPAFK